MVGADGHGGRHQDTGLTVHSLCFSLLFGPRCDVRVFETGFLSVAIGCPGTPVDQASLIPAVMPPGQERLLSL